MLNIFSSGTSRKGPSAHISLLAFGKHPGWDDHIPDLGDTTNRLIEVKRELYVEGIGGNIDSGAWDRLEDEHRLEHFQHIFLWRSSQDVVVGRLWSSSDGKGRKRYPMIVCAQCVGVSLPWIVNELIPRFSQIEQQCKATNSSSEVISIIDSARTELMGLAGAEGLSASGQEGLQDPLAELADHADMGEDQEGLLRVLYQIEGEVVGQKPGRANAPVRAKHIRVPMCTSNPPDALSLWTRFLVARFGSQPISALIILPLEQNWVDLIVGDGVAPQLYGIRVLPSKLPLTTEVPYNLDEQFIQQARQAISASDRSASTGSLLPGARSKSDASRSQVDGQVGSKKRSSLKWFLLFVSAIVVVVVTLVILVESGVVGEDFKRHLMEKLEHLKSQTQQSSDQVGDQQ